MSKIIKRGESPEWPVVVLPRAPLQSRDLSLAAKGLLCMILEKPDDWTVSIAALEAEAKEGRHALRSALCELERAGYVHRRQVRIGGRWSPESVVFDEPQFDAVFSLTPSAPQRPPERPPAPPAPSPLAPGYVSPPMLDIEEPTPTDPDSSPDPTRFFRLDDTLPIVVAEYLKICPRHFEAAIREHCYGKSLKQPGAYMLSVLKKWRSGVDTPLAPVQVSPDADPNAARRRRMFAKDARP